MLLVNGVLEGTKMNNPLLLQFTEKTSGRELQITLYSKFTCIDGKESGEGKTELLVRLQQGISLGEIECNLGDSFAIADGSSIGALLNSRERLVIMTDESTLLRQDLLTKISKSKHVFVSITRAMLLRMDYSMMGIYVVERTSDDWFTIKNAESLPLITDSASVLEADTIVTESHVGRSEYELLNRYFNNLKAAGGRDRIEAALRQCNTAVVFADLASIGRAYRLLKKRCQQNDSIHFYPYQCFEQLLFESPLIQDIANAPALRHTKIGEALFDYETIERYYEDVLERLTANTKLEYKHGKGLAKVFLDETQRRAILDSNVGKLLLDAVDSDGCKKLNAF